MPANTPLDPFRIDCGRLTPVRRVPPPYGDGQWWEFRCECGKSCRANLAVVNAGRTRSCGCYQRDMASRRGPATRDRQRTGPLLDPAKVRAARLARGLTLRQLAAIAGMGRRCVTYYERVDALPPRPATLVKLAAALGVPPGALTA